MGAIALRKRVVAALAVAITTLVLVLALDSSFRFGVDGPVSNPTDFRAMYCAGSALASGADPYRYGPLRRCQDRVLAGNGLAIGGRNVLPVPLPPYAIVVFALASKIGFRLASEIWLAFNIVALGLTVFVVSKMTSIRPAFVAIPFLTIGYASLVIGQLVPIAVLGAAYAAWSLRRDDRLGVAIGASVCAIEPHLAAPMWFALLLFAPRTRVSLALAVACLIAISLPLWSLDLEYVARVLPLHARSQAYDMSSQFSLTTTLVALGVPVATAIRAGTFSYVVTFAIGIALAVRLSKRFDDTAFLTLAPTAAVLLGGEYVHGHQMEAALPFAFLVADRVRVVPFARTIVILAICALAVPWQNVAESPVFIDRFDNHPLAAARPILASPRDSDFADVPYIAYVDAYAGRFDRRSVPVQIAWKLPVWCALSGLLLLGIALTRHAPVERSSTGGLTSA